MRGKATRDSVQRSRLLKRKENRSRGPNRPRQLASTTPHRYPKPAHYSASQFKFTVALRPYKPLGLLGTGSPRRPPRLSHSSWASEMLLFYTAVATIQFSLSLYHALGKPRKYALHPVSAISLTLPSNLWCYSSWEMVTWGQYVPRTEGVPQSENGLLCSVLLSDRKERNHSILVLSGVYLYNTYLHSFKLPNTCSHDKGVGVWRGT